MPIGAALRGFGAILKGGKRSPTISSVKASVHKTKKAQKDARMKEQFDKQKSRTLSDRKMGKKEMTLTEYANRRTKKAEGGRTERKPKNPLVPTPKEFAKLKKIFHDESRARIREKGRDKKADGGAITPRDINKNGKTDGFERARAKGMAKGMGRQFRDSKADGGKATYKTKDGRTVKKGLYYYMNRAKKRGTSKPGKGSVTDKALRDSAKTAKKD
jgi:hypothetical protein